MRLVSRPVKNIPIESDENVPLALLGQGVGSSRAKDRRHRRYTKAYVIETLAINKYKSSGKGITFKDLLTNGLAPSTTKAQITLKNCLKKNILLTLQYYPACLKSEISKKNIPIGVTGVNHPNAGLSKCIHPSAGPFAGLDPVIVKTLEGFILPLLPKSPLHIHKMQFKLKVPLDLYHEILLPLDRWNRGKQHEEIIGRVHVRYRFYANGTIVVFTENSNAPFKLEDEVDLSRLIAFFGQVRDRLVLFLADKHERIVPDIMQWEMTQLDINKDVKVSDWFQSTQVKVQIRHLDHLFRVYIKSMGGNTVCRVEESRYSVNKPAIEAINDIFNPFDKNERRFIEQDKKLAETFDRLEKIEARQSHSSDDRDRSCSKTAQEKMEQEAITAGRSFGCEDNSI